MGDTYTFAHECRTDSNGLTDYGRWVLRRRAADPPPDEHPAGVVLAFLPGSGEHAADDRYQAMSWATNALYAHQVRAVAWHPTPTPDGDPRELAHVAEVAPSWYGGWEVTVWRGGNRLWYTDSRGSWFSDGGTRYPDLDALQRAEGPLIPFRVDVGLPALIAELMIRRAVGGWFDGPAECMDAACSEFEDAEAAGRKIEHCSHMTHHIASRADTFRLQRIDRELRELDGEASPVLDPANIVDPATGKPYTPARVAAATVQARAVDAVRYARDYGDEA